MTVDTDNVDLNDVAFLPKETFLKALRAAGKPEPGELPTAQWVVTGGEEVLELELARWAGYGVQRDKAAAHAYVIEQYGKFRSEAAVLLMADMAAKSQAKRNASAWLVEHGEQCRVRGQGRGTV